jgi:hypothetical protein
MTFNVHGYGLTLCVSRADSEILYSLIALHHWRSGLLWNGSLEGDSASSQLFFIEPIGIAWEEKATSNWSMGT